MRLEVETSVKKHKPKVDPLNDVSFTGEFDEDVSPRSISFEEVVSPKK